MNYIEISDCGCSEPDEEIERILRELGDEEEDQPELIPFETPIPAPDVFVPKRVEVDVR